MRFKAPSRALCALCGKSSTSTRRRLLLEALLFANGHEHARDPPDMLLIPPVTPFLRVSKILFSSVFAFSADLRPCAGRVLQQGIIVLYLHPIDNSARSPIASRKKYTGQGHVFFNTLLLTGTCPEGQSAPFQEFIRNLANPCALDTCQEVACLPFSARKNRWQVISCTGTNPQSVLLIGCAPTPVLNAHRVA